MPEKKRRVWWWMGPVIVYPGGLFYDKRDRDVMHGLFSPVYGEDSYNLHFILGDRLG